MADCIVTVTDPEFLPGTEVLLHSFLSHNPWFEGTLIVFQEGLTGEERARLERVGPVEFREPHPELAQRVGRVAERIPAFAPIQRRFLALELYGLEGFDRVLYLDSDLLCMGSLEPLLRTEHPLLACPDQFPYREPGPAREQHVRRYYGRRIEGSFNGGVISVGPAYLNRRTYQELLAVVDPDLWRNVDTRMSIAVQLVLNTYFEGKAALASSKYNFLISLEPEIQAQTGLAFEDIVIMHFVGVPKPWQETAWRPAVEARPGLRKFFRAWQRAHTACMASR